MSTLKATNIKNESSASNNIVLDSGGGVVVSGVTTFSSAVNFSGSGDITLGTGTTISSPASNTFTVSTNGSERVRIDSSGRFGVGTATPNELFEVRGTQDQGIRLTSTAGSGEGANLQWYSEQTGDNKITAEIESDGESAGGRLEFKTRSQAGALTSAVRITSTGAFKQVGENASHVNTGQPYNEFVIDQTTADVVLLKQENTSSTENIISGYHARSASSSFRFMSMFSSGGSDLEFHLRGDGNAYCDGSWNGGGADYAEYFEWSDGNTADEDRCGISVVLENGKIREAVDGESPIGVISGNPSVTGDAAQDKWVGKHLTDDYGRYIWEDHNSVVWDETYTDEQGKEKTRRVKYEDWQIPAGVIVPADATITSHDENGNKLRHRVVNPAYDPDAIYIPREQRPEWDCVGLMGKLRIRKGQVTGSRWIKMRDISDTVEEWLVR